MGHSNLVLQKITLSGGMQALMKYEVWLGLTPSYWSKIEKLMKCQFRNAFGNVESTQNELLDKSENTYTSKHQFNIINKNVTLSCHRQTTVKK